MIKYALFASVLLCGSAVAHDAYDNGIPIPAWIKKYCCSVTDFHRLPASDVWEEADGWHVRGIKTVVPANLVDASQDQYAYVFYPNGSDTPFIWCIFIPMSM